MKGRAQYKNFLQKFFFKKKQTCSHPQLSRALGSIMGILALSLLGKTKTNNLKRYNGKKQKHWREQQYKYQIQETCLNWWLPWLSFLPVTKFLKLVLNLTQVSLIVLKKRRAPFPPGGAAAIDEEVDRGVDPQEKVVRTRQAEKIGWRREKPEKERKWGGHSIENLPHLIRFSTMKSSPMMRMTLGKLEMGVPSSPQ